LAHLLFSLQAAGNTVFHQKAPGIKNKN